MTELTAYTHTLRTTLVFFQVCAVGFSASSSFFWKVFVLHDVLPLLSLFTYQAIFLLAQTDPYCDKLRHSKIASPSEPEPEPEEEEDWDDEDGEDDSEEEDQEDE